MNFNKDYIAGVLEFRMLFQSGNCIDEQPYKKIN